MVFKTCLKFNLCFFIKKYIKIDIERYVKLRMKRGSFMKIIVNVVMLFLAIMPIYCESLPSESAAVSNSILDDVSAAKSFGKKISKIARKGLEHSIKLKKLGNKPHFTTHKPVKIRYDKPQRKRSKQENIVYKPFEKPEFLNDEKSSIIKRINHDVPVLNSPEFNVILLKNDLMRVKNMQKESSLNRIKLGDNDIGEIIERVDDMTETF